MRGLVRVGGAPAVSSILLGGVFVVGNKRHQDTTFKKRRKEVPTSFLKDKEDIRTCGGSIPLVYIVLNYVK